MSVSTIKIETDLITLMKVLNQTGNPTVAIQILNGTYQEPEFCKDNRASSPSKNGTREEYIFESYDIWTDIVHYKVSEHYYSKDTSRAQWEKLDLWSDHVRRAMAEAILNDVDDIADTEHGF